MTSEARSVTIDAAVELIIDHRGRTPKKLGGDFSSTGVQVVSAKNVHGGRVHLDENRRFVPREMAERWMPNKLMPGDVLLTSEAPLGEAAYLDGHIDVCLGQRLFALRGRPTITDRRFLYYALRSPLVQRRLHARATGTTAQGIKQSELRQVELELPPVSEQERIAAVLGSLDDKIDSDRRLASLLEEVAAELFRARFIDFVGVEPLVDSEIGHIPGGWHVKRVSDLCGTQYGYTATASKSPIGPKFLRVMDINKRPWIDWSDVPYCEATDAQLAKYRLRHGDIVVARMADPGKVAICDDVDGEAVFASYLVRLTTKDLPTAYFLHGFLSSDRYQGAYVSAAAGGSVQKNMNAQVIVGAQLAVPRTAEIEAFAAIVGPLRARIAAAIRESDRLRSIRDALLPRLLSGATRVPETIDLDEVTNDLATTT